jgi:hypothetical protein
MIMRTTRGGLGSFTKAFIQAGVTLMAILAAGQGGANEAAVEREIHAQPSWILATDDVEVAVTKLGGHMAPVTFDRRGRPFQPYHISPWQDERIKDLPAAVLAPHGEPATAAWTLAGRGREADGTETLTLTLGTQVRPGTITKRLAIASGQPVVYSTHVIEGFAGPAPLGHHATLAMPEKDGAVAVSVSPFKLGMTNPGVFSDPASGEYQALALGATFTDLARVPSLFKSPAEVDCSRFPTRRGYADLLAMVADKAALGGGPAWTAAVNTADGWVWFALRDPDVLPTTVFWIENRGRHGSPWNGRNNCLGLEDVCGFFADGLVPSTQDNALTKQGVRTAVELDAKKPTEIRYIQGAARVPAGFDRVKRIDFSKAGQIGLVSDSGQTVTVPVNHAFVFGKRP